MEEVEEKAHRRGTSGGSWEAGSVEKDNAGVGAGGPSLYPEQAPVDAYAAYPQAHDYTSSGYPPAHDFTAGPAGAYGYTGEEQYGYADMQRGGDPNAQYYADPAQHGAELMRGPSANYGQPAHGADLMRGPSANYGQPAQGADLMRGPSANYGPHAQYAVPEGYTQEGYEQAYAGYGNNGGYPASGHGQQYHGGY
ncbi:hypothetical protein CALCODRAFT_484789 [Calocera cornea HHB12733]|uniref:Uncharacterized protein n=1 Tax=Calocera cornea HHB12733 TaxID=1353952 RepID=A0A165ES23_9BASI|nr:hypothetical protein CALCODRAFT_484789 [Calocera cornea HHB12733]